MSRIVYSAFSDEITPALEGQIRALKQLGISMTELRGVNGKSFVQLTNEEIDEVRQSLAAANITVSALGSPIGKMEPDGDFKEHLKLFERVMDIGDRLGAVFTTRRIRFFSFYPRSGQNRADFKAEATERIDTLLTRAQERGFVLCHENEKGVYGESPEQVRELCDIFGQRLRLALDNGNFAFCGYDASHTFELLNDHIEYYHIKDSELDGTIVPPGCGRAFLKELISHIKADPRSEAILTIEPHLCDFTGLASLAADGKIEHRFSFASPYEAFETAYNAVLKLAE